MEDIVTARLYRTRQVVVEVTQRSDLGIWVAQFPTGEKRAYTRDVFDALFEPVVEIDHGFVGEGAAAIDDTPLPFGDAE